MGGKGFDGFGVSGEFAGDAMNACENADDVAVNHCCGIVLGDGTDCGSGVRTDSGVLAILPACWSFVSKAM